MIRFASGATAGVLALVLAAAAAGAQTPPLIRHVVAEGYFIGADDSLTVELSDGQVYRLEYTGRSGAPRVHRVDRRRTRAFLNPRDDGSWELYPVASDVHLIRVISLAAGDTVRVRILADVAETEARRQRRTERRSRALAVGVSAGGSARSAFALSGGPGAEVVSAGRELEAGLWAGVPVSRFSTLLGAAWSGEAGDSPGITWFFVEPRVRLLERARFELGTSLRFGMATIRNGERNPSLVAPGTFIAYRLTDSPTHRGPRAHAGYAYGIVDNVGGKWMTTHRGTAGLTWIF